MNPFALTADERAGAMMEPALLRCCNPALAFLPALNMPAASDEARPDVLTCYAKSASEPLVAMPHIVKAFCLRDGEGRRDVLTVVSRLAKNFKVLNAVVGLVSVFVVNVLLCAKRAPKVAFHNNSMLVSLPTSDRHDPVSGFVQSVFELARELARFRAKLGRRHARAECCAAMGACVLLFHNWQNTATHRGMQL